ncbi:MAG TPA: TIGR04282 family arsenosugar biosynthesis glycosyltransferase [Candidatus Nanoarchaeia archaeon]|nr:TIGR04282 family arsenosugar biosynthesis glycosyltransferase [Candidatus Nanoarchaeia archaeon]
MDSALVIFTRYPEEGKVKTKLALHIGEKHAAEFCRCMLHDLLNKHKSHSYDTIVAFTPREKGSVIKSEYPSASIYMEQVGNNFGERAMHLFRSLLKKYKKVVAIGSDVPDLDPLQVHKAFMALDAVDMVIGPALDGSYYLVGMRRPIDIFSMVAGYYPEILRDTMRLIDRQGYTYALLEKKTDIDDIDTFRSLKRRLKKEQAPLTYQLLKKIKV